MAVDVAHDLLAEASWLGFSLASLSPHIAAFLVQRRVTLTMVLVLPVIYVSQNDLFNTTYVSQSLFCF